MPWSSLKYAVQNNSTTNTKAPTILPRVTGRRLPKRNDFILRLASWSALKPEAAAIAGVAFKNKPLEIKYIFAILCSYPDATNVVIGKKIAKILPITWREDEAIQIARQTSQLQRIPLVKASTNVRLTFVYAVVRPSTPKASWEL